LDRLRHEIRAKAKYVRREFADMNDGKPAENWAEPTFLRWLDEYADRLDGCMLLLALPKRKVRARDPARAARARR